MNEKMVELQKNALADEAKKLEQELKTFEVKVAALTEEVAQKRTEAQEKFRDKYAPRFKDIDTSLALIGMPQVHKVSIGGAVYGIRPPSGEVVRQVDAFLLDPTVQAVRQADGSVSAAENLGPMSRDEDVLLKWLVSVQGPGQPERQIASNPIPQRLKLIRGLPALLLRSIAGECDTLDTYLGIVLELEINAGNC